MLEITQLNFKIILSKLLKNLKFSITLTWQHETRFHIILMFKLLFRATINSQCNFFLCMFTDIVPSRGGRGEEEPWWRKFSARKFSQKKKINSEILKWMDGWTTVYDKFKYTAFFLLLFKKRISAKCISKGNIENRLQNIKLPAYVIFAEISTICTFHKKNNF